MKAASICLDATAHPTRENRRYRKKLCFLGFLMLTLRVVLHDVWFLLYGSQKILRLMRSVLKMMAVARRGIWKLITLLAFTASVCDLPLSAILLLSEHARITADSLSSAASPHQCACELSGVVCRCQSDCCGESSSNTAAFCQQLSPLAVPAAPSILPVTTMRDYLQRKHSVPVFLDVLMVLKLVQQQSPSSWFAPPDSPPPRLLSGIC